MPDAIQKRKSTSKNDDASAVLKQPLSEQAYIAIKQMILGMELRPGDYVSVGQLSDRLALGRSPVHAAIHRLNREGLLEILPRKGIIVKVETSSSFVELVDARLLVEPYLTGLAAERADAKLLADLKSLIAAGKKLEKAGDHEGAMRVDRLFHQRIYEGSGNRMLSDFAAQLLDRSLRLWFLPMFHDGEGRSNIGELENIFLSIKARDRGAAERKMQVHISAIRKKFAVLAN